MSTNDVLLTMRDVRIDGFSDDRWHHIIKGVDVTLKRERFLALLANLVRASQHSDWQPWGLSVLAVNLWGVA